MKKNKTNPYIIYLLKGNLLYLIVLLALGMGTFFAPYYLINKYLAGKAVLTQTETDLRDLRQKREILLSSIDLSAGTLDQDVKVMNSLIPDSEDYFSIIYTLDQLSKKTNFVINQYQINLSNSTSQRLSLTVSGIGDIQSFMNFLKDYNFAGGRLVTVDTIGIEPQKENQLKLALNFYNASPPPKTRAASQTSSGTESLDYRTALKQAEDLRGKVSFVLTSPDEEGLTPYPTKANPF